MKNIIALATTGLMAISFAAQAEIDLSKLPPASTKTGVTFATDIKPLFDASCVRCHGPKEAKGRIHLDTLEGVLKGGEDGKIVEVGQSAKSSLVIAISQLDPETAMPPKRKGKGKGKGPGAPGGTNAPADAHGPGEMHGTNAPGANARPQKPPAKPLTAEEVGLVRAWIDQGAK